MVGSRPVAPLILPPGRVLHPHSVLDQLHHRRTEKKIREVGVELRSPSLGNRFLRLFDAPCPTVPAGVRNGVEGVGDRNDPRS